MSEKTPEPPTPTSHDAYAARRNDIARLIDVLGMELDRHAERAKALEACWDQHGDLGKVRDDLIGLVAFMSGMERELIENFLADSE